SYANVRRKPLEFQVGDRVMLKVSPRKGIIRFGKREKLNIRYIRPFKILKRFSPLAYKLELPEELSNVHNTFHVSNLKKCLFDESLVIPMKELRLDDKLNFVEELVEIMDREVKQLKQSRIPIIKGRSYLGSYTKWKWTCINHHRYTRSNQGSASKDYKRDLSQGKRKKSLGQFAHIGFTEDHLAKFHKITDAKEMWDAIKSRFSRNDESKKMQKYILKQQFEGFSVSNLEGLHKGYDKFQSLLSQLEMHRAGRRDSLSFDDLYNNLRVFENDVKGSTISPSSTQNVAFISENTISTNDVSIAYGVSNPSGHNSQYEQTSSYSLLANQSSCPQLDHEDLEQLDEFDLEEMDLKWQVAMISIKNEKVLYKRQVRKRIQFDAKEPIGFDKTKVECYNCHKTGHFARECRTKGNQDSKRRNDWNSGNKDGKRSSKQEDSKALVTINGESVDWTSHSEEEEDYALMLAQFRHKQVTSCSKECKESYVTKKLYDEKSKISDVRIELQAYTQGLKKLKAQLVTINRFVTKVVLHVESLSHLIRDCDFHEKRMAKQAELNNRLREKSSQREIRPICNNVQRVNHQNQFVPTAVLTRTGKILVSTARASGGAVGGRRSLMVAILLLEEVSKGYRTGNDFNLFSVSQICDKKNKFFSLTPDYLVLSLNLVTWDFIEFCGSKGIKREYSNARTPQQNGVAERKNRTLIEAARTMLVDSFLPNTFWAEAVSTAWGKGQLGLFDLDYLTDSMNYQPVRSENQANKHAGPQEANHNAGTEDIIDAGDSEKEVESAQDYFVLPIWSSYSSTVKRSKAKDAGEAPYKRPDLKINEKSVDKEDQVFLDELERLKRQEQDANDAAEALRKEFQFA
ncbi:ribonuclease H-like domain-containing protein, partial [Tanacetum coccineum]